MSTQIGQYLVYGSVFPYSISKTPADEDGDSFYERYERFQQDNIFHDEIVHHEGVAMLFDGRDGKYIIVGRILAKAKDGDYLGIDSPLIIGGLSELEKEFIGVSLARNFDFFTKDSRMDYIFVTVLR